MKKIVMSVVTAAMIVGSIASASATNLYHHQTVYDQDVKVEYYGNQENFNKHAEGSMQDLRETDNHLQREVTGFKSEARGRLDDQQEQLFKQGEKLNNVEQWTDRQEGVLRQNRGRLDDHDKDIAGLREVDAGLSSAIQETNNQVSVTDERSINTAVRVDGVESAVRETNAQLEVTDERSIHTAVRVDAVEAKNVQQDVSIKKNSDGVSENREHIGFLKEADVKLAKSIDETNDRSLNNERVNVEQTEYIKRNSDLIDGYYRQSSARMDYQQQQISSNTGRIEKLENDVDDLKGGVALGIATSSLQYDLSSTASTQLSVGAGYYDAHSAMAIGLGTRVNDRTFINVNASSTSDGRMGAGAGLTFNLN